MSTTVERDSVTKKTSDLLVAFEQALERTKRIRAELNSAECAEANARNEVAKWLTPKDAKPGEQFNIWWGNRLVSVVHDGRDGMVSIREARL